MTKHSIAMALALSLGLAACSEEAAAPVAAEGTVPGLEISDARLVLPPVAGNPAAVYFNITNDSDRGLSISGAQVEGAESAAVHAMMEYNFEMTMSESGPIAIVPGEEVKFEPGSFHVMAFGLPDTLKAGDKAEVTLMISGGARQKFEADVRGAGEER